MPSRLTRPARPLVAAAILLVLGAAPVRAQSSLEDAIKQYSASSIEGYLQPLADVLVANLSSGYYESASVGHKLSFSLSLIGMGTALSDKLKTYTANTPAGWSPATFTTPTVFGGTATPVSNSNDPQFTYRGSDGVMNGDYFPTAVPQLQIGGIAGTALSVRYFSSSLVSSLPKEDFPELKLLGIGLQHSLNRYLPGLPFDLSIGGSYNSLTLGDLVDLKGTSIGAQVGKTFKMLGLYGGLASESGTLNLKYTSTDPAAPGAVDVDLKSKSDFRFTAGASLHLGFLRLFGDASFGNVTTYSGGLRFGL